MKLKYILNIFFLGCTIYGFSCQLNRSTPKNSLAAQLAEFNYNWSKYSHKLPVTQRTSFSNDASFVYTHLSYVIPILEKASISHLTHEQQFIRKKLITYLKGYKSNRKYPLNKHFKKRTPVFIDEEGTHCAVAHLMQKTGYDHVAQSISTHQNYAWVKDIEHEALGDLQKQSGFSIEEIKLIQGAYDFYMPNALYAPNKYEIPQKPDFMTIYFDKKEKQRIWCKGEGKDGILNGKWIQNYSQELPWIEGFFIDGKRSGQWKEYYKGTNKLCRTENWRNDKLNGVRKRFDRSGKLIEEIQFKDGNAILKTNYDHHLNIKYIRKPIDSLKVHTRIMNFDGYVLAEGHEVINNPSNLMWFQNIELTALNTAAIVSRSEQSNSTLNSSHQGISAINLYNQPQLVSYKKEGDWIYFSNYKSFNRNHSSETSLTEKMHSDFPLLTTQTFRLLSLLPQEKNHHRYDSLAISYKDDNIIRFNAIGTHAIHLAVDYYEQEPTFSPLFNQSRSISQYNPFRQNPLIRRAKIKTIGHCDQAGNKIGLWYHYDQYGTLIRKEEYLVAVKVNQDQLGSL